MDSHGLYIDLRINKKQDLSVQSRPAFLFNYFYFYEVAL